MDTTINQFLDKYIEIWRNSSFFELRDIISKDYEAREISGGKIIDFGYEDSIKGWEEGFNFAKENQAQWDLNKLSVTPIRDKEILVLISATLIINGQSLDTASLFFQTFKNEKNDDWKLIRSYIETGVFLTNSTSTQSI